MSKYDLSSINLSHLLGGPHFRHSLVLCSKGYGIRINALVDTGAQGFLFISSTIAKSLSKALHISIQSLPYPVMVKGFSDRIRTPVRHYIRLHMRIDGRLIRNCPLVIMDLGTQDCIIGMRWLKRFKLRLDTDRNRIIWPAKYPKTYEANKTLLMQLEQKTIGLEAQRDMERRETLWEQDEFRRRTSPGNCSINYLRLPRAPTQLPPPKPTRRTTYKKPPRPPRLAPREEPPAVSGQVRTNTIALISANAFHFNLKRPSNEFFTTSLYEIERISDYIRRTDVPEDPDNARLVRDLLPPEYRPYADVFSKSQSDELPPHRPYDHKLVLTEPPPNSYTPLYKQSLEELEATKKYVMEHLQKGFIEASQSPFASPILCVRKPNGDIRICVDYRKLNLITRKDSYPLPRIDELLSRPSKAKIFTKLDIRAAFNRIRMDPDSEEYTTFRTRYGSYKCKVLPFGLTNGPATFMRYMNDVLIDFLDDFCIAYLDDILIYSDSEEEHEGHVRKVLARLRRAGLQADIQKSEFHVTRTRYLGYVLTNTGLEVDPGKVEALRNWKEPTTVTGVKSFLGFAGYYRQFVRDFSRIAKPLSTLQSPQNQFVWTPECSTAFEKIKNALLAMPSLYHFHPELDTRVETDASDGVIAGVLSQRHDDKYLPVAFYSKVLSGSELNWEIHDKELFAIITAFQQWRAELASTRNVVEVLTDHRSLEYFMTTKVLNPRQVRWAEFLAPFDLRIKYTPGRNNARADILSRREQDLTHLRSTQEKDRFRVLLGPHRLDPRINTELAAKHIAQTTTEVGIFQLATDASPMGLDSFGLIEALLQDNRASFESEREALPEGYRIQDGLLLYQGRLCVRPGTELSTRLIREIHDQPSTAHPGSTKTYQLLAKKYHWKGMEATCKRYVRNCVACQRSHPRQTRLPGYLHPLPIPDKPMQHLCIDFKEFPKDTSGYDQVMVIIDRLSKQAISIPCHKTIDARGMARLFVDWVYRFGHTPETIVSDRGPQFVSTFWSEFCRILGVQVKLSTAYHKETDGQTEIMNKYIDQRLRPFVNYYQDNWSSLLPLMDRAQATLPHSAIGMSPYELLYGSEPRQSWDWNHSGPVKPSDQVNVEDARKLTQRMHAAWQLAKINMEKAQDRMRSVVNRHRRPIDWDVGDMVYLDTRNLAVPRPSRKLSEKWEGPFKVVEKVGHSYRLQLPKGSRIHDVFAPNLLHKDPQAPLPGQETPKPPGIPIDGVEEWEVEKILASKLYRKTLKYRVQWVGHDPDPTWYPAANFIGAPHMLKSFHDTYPDRPGPPKALEKWISEWGKK